MKRAQKLLSIFTLLALFSLMVVTPAYAFDGRTGNSVTIKEGEVINDDLYVSAETFTLNGTVKGDVIVAGSLITINGTVEGDLIAAGQTVVINGKVADDARIFGAALQLGENATVGSDVIAAGGSVETKAGSTIGHDLVVGSGQALLAGDVTGKVLAGTSALELRGSYGGDVKAYVDANGQGNSGPPMNTYMPNIPISLPSVTPGLTVADTAQIKGNLEYTSTTDLSIPAGVVGGKINRIAVAQSAAEVPVRQPSNAEKVGNWIFRLIRTIVILLLFSLGFNWLFPKFMKALPETLKTQPLPSLGWGAITFAAFFFSLFGVLLVTILLAIVGLGGPMVWFGMLTLSGITLAFIIATTYLTKIVVGEALGKWMLGLINPTLAEHKIWPTVAGVIVLILGIGLLGFPLLPFGFFGWLLNFAVILFGLGTLWIWGRTVWQARQTA